MRERWGGGERSSRGDSKSFAWGVSRDNGERGVCRGVSVRERCVGGEVGREVKRKAYEH